MAILGRSPARLWSAAGRLPEFSRASWRCVRLFRSPWTVLSAYIRRRNPASGRVTLRDGLVIHLSGDHSDIVTVFLVFCRHDYGVVEPGSEVVDIGANIGVFALFAAWCGAARVRAYEPTEESFTCLERNVRENQLQDRVLLHRAAVVGRPTGPVWFPRRSSVFNAIGGAGADTDRQEVATVTLSEILAGGEAVDLMKLDCEGGEYDILLHSPPAVFDAVRTMKLEYHRGPQAEMMAALDRLGYRRRQFMDEGEGGGYLWLVR